MKTKILLIVAAVILFTTSQLHAVDDKIFTSSGQILPGEEWENVYIYNDDTIVDMLGGLVDSIGTYDASTVNVTGGDVSTLVAHEFSTANVSAGYVYTLWARDSGTATLSGTGSVISLSSRGSFGTVNMTGGSTEYARAGDSGTLNLYGGVVTNSLNAWDSAAINIFGYDLFKTATGGTYGYGFVTGFWGDGTPFSINFNTSETHSHINLIPVVYVEVDIKPESLNLASKGKWVTCKIWLPEDYNVANINPDTILLERMIKPVWTWVDEEQQLAMAKFSQSEVQGILEVGELELTISGQLIDGMIFEGTDTIRVIDKGRLHRRRVNSNSKVEDGIEYYIQTDKAVYNLGENVEMLYRVTNLGSEEVTFAFPGSPEWNFWVEKHGENIWTAVLGWYWFSPGIALSVGESKEFPYLWDMRDHENNLLVNVGGGYSVIGGLDGAATEFYDFTRISVGIKIVPEPKGRVKHN